MNSYNMEWSIKALNKYESSMQAKKIRINTCSLQKSKITKSMEEVVVEIMKEEEGLCKGFIDQDFLR